jgi:nucleoside-diphosphate-sugar epimerase
VGDSAHERVVLVVGASGVIGESAVRRFAGQPRTTVIGASRRPPRDAGGTFLPLDLRDADACRTAVRPLGAVTHLVYAALWEMPGLVAGWRDEEHVRVNLAMFRAVLDPLVEVADGLRHVTLLQGTKAYGAHLGVAIPVPAKERAPRVEHPNFYFAQEDHLRDVQRRAGAWFAATILRPQVVYGESVGSPMNLIPVIGVYGALLRDAGSPLAFPGGAARVSEAVDADLLAAVIDWAGTSAAAADETFNVTNGDVFTWRSVWPAIAAALGMEAGPDEPLRLADWLPTQAGVWASLVRGHGLAAPEDLDAFVGQSPIYADILFGAGADPAAPAPPPTLVSTVKLRQAGFHDCVDTEDMFSRLLARMQQRRLLPPR